MSYVKNQDARVKAIKKYMSMDDEHRSEYDIVGVVSPKRKGYIPTELLKDCFDRYGETSGATKCCHLHNKLDSDKPFEYIVLKRIKEDYWPGLGNQIADEIRCYLKYQNTPEADYINPILRYEMHRGDKVNQDDDRYLNNSMIICQRAMKVSRLDMACYSAEKMNQDAGIFYPESESAENRKNALLKFAKKNHWRDVQQNHGNCGVIFDYAAGRFKAVIIDYAL